MEILEVSKKSDSSNLYDKLNDSSLISNISFLDSNGNKVNFYIKTEKDISKQINEFCKKNKYSKNIEEMIENKIQKKIQDKMKLLEEDISDPEYDSTINKKNVSSKEFNKFNYENNSICNNSTLKSKNKNNDMINSKEFNQKSNKKNEIKKIIQNKKNLSVDSLYERKMFFYKKKKNKEHTNEIFKNEFNFKPRLNNYNKILNKSSDNIRNGHFKLSVEDRLIMLGNKSKKKLSKIIQLYYAKDFENNNFTYTPKINKYKRKNKNKNTYVSLYEDAKEIKKKINNKREILFKKTCSFHPKINTNSKNMEISTFNKFFSENKNCVTTEIIIKPYKEIQKKDFDLKYENEEIKNDRLTKPKVSKEVNVQKKNWMKSINQKIEEQKIKIYKNIFDVLDFNKNNFISYQTIDLSKFNKKMLSIISPILNEIIENKEEMVTFKEFIEKADKIIPKKIFKK